MKKIFIFIFIVFTILSLQINAEALSDDQKEKMALIFAERQFDPMFGEENSKLDAVRDFLVKVDEEEIYKSNRAKSKYILGYAYVMGMYKEKNCRKAYLWFNEACKSGMMEACTARNDLQMAGTNSNVYPGGTVIIENRPYTCPQSF